MFYSVTSSINAGVNQTFFVTLLDTMIHLVVNEALLFNIFTRGGLIPGPWTNNFVSSAPYVTTLTDVDGHTWLHAPRFVVT